MTNTSNLTNNPTNLNLVCEQLKHFFYILGASPYPFLVSFFLLSLLIPTTLHPYAQELPLGLPSADMIRISFFGLYFVAVSARAYRPFITLSSKRNLWSSFTSRQCVAPVTVAVLFLTVFVLGRYLDPVSQRDPNCPDLYSREETPLELSTREFRERVAEQQANWEHACEQRDAREQHNAFLQLQADRDKVREA